VVAKVRKSLTISKQETQKFDGERFNFREIRVNVQQVRKQYQIEI
jgi:hypothetical protein